MIADESLYDVSVVVPLYNVSEFMPKCVDSLLAQSLGGRLQIVLVDDDSPDSSGRLADEYAALHSNITCVHRRNGGLGPARNSGIDASLGVYIGFVDGDDWVDSTMYEVLYKKAEETGADAVFSGMKTVTHGDVADRFPVPYGDRVFRGKKETSWFRTTFYGARPAKVPMEPMQVSVCPAIYRASIFREQGVSFERVRSEDIVFNLDYLRHASIVACVADIYYNYRKDDQPSITSTFKSRTIDEYFELFDAVASRLKIDKGVADTRLFEESDIRFRRRVIDCSRGMLSGIYSRELEPSLSSSLADKVLKSDYLSYATRGYPWWKLSIKQAVFFLALKTKSLPLIRTMVDLEQRQRGARNAI